MKGKRKFIILIFFLGSTETYFKQNIAQKKTHTQFDLTSSQLPKQNGIPSLPAGELCIYLVFPSFLDAGLINKYLLLCFIKKVATCQQGCISSGTLETFHSTSVLPVRQAWPVFWYLAMPSWIFQENCIKP